MQRLIKDKLKPNSLNRAFDPGKDFQQSLMYVGKARRLPNVLCLGRVWPYPPKIDLGWKPLSSSNALSEELES